MKDRAKITSNLLELRKKRQIFESYAAEALADGHPQIAEVWEHAAVAISRRESACRQALPQAGTFAAPGRPYWADITWA
jgi:hypothetical protein